MNISLVIAVSLASGVAVLALATRRKPVDPLARAARAATAAAAAAAPDEHQGAHALRMAWKLMRNGSDTLMQVAEDLRAGRKDEAIACMREAAGLELADATRVVDEIESQLASNGPLARLLDRAGAPPPK